MENNFECDLDEYLDNVYKRPKIINNDMDEISKTEDYGNITGYILKDIDIEALKSGKLMVVFPLGDYTCIFKYQK